MRRGRNTHFQGFFRDLYQMAKKILSFGVPKTQDIYFCDPFPNKRLLQKPFFAFTLLNKSYRATKFYTMDVQQPQRPGKDLTIVLIVFLICCILSFIDEIEVFGFALATAP